MDPVTFRGKTALITGGNGGIGLGISRGLAAGGARLLIPVHNRTRGEITAATLRAEFPGADIKLFSLDLESLASVRALSAQLRKCGEPIHLAMLNAGVVRLAEGPREVTVDGFEATFQANYLGHIALITAIMRLLRAGSARVVAQVSLAADRGRIHWENLQGETGYRSFTAYSQSKVALGLSTVELARRSQDHGWGISAGLAHPGVVPGSGIAPRLRRMFPAGMVHWAERTLGNPPAQAAGPALAALASRESCMWAPSRWSETAGPAVKRTPFSSLTDLGDAARLWGATESLLGICAAQ
ncbi:SDR family NAD(P)-dependent oxidoreductase [Acidipropionibacterium virtanenii]|nr:SDR family NAD(P)-dependent oxidoreductase [Acidipropionibacterium virtanenii]